MTPNHQKDNATLREHKVNRPWRMVWLLVTETVGPNSWWKRTIKSEAILSDFQGGLRLYIIPSLGGFWHPCKEVDWPLWNTGKARTSGQATQHLTRYYNLGLLAPGHSTVLPPYPPIPLLLKRVRAQLRRRVLIMGRSMLKPPGSLCSQHSALQLLGTPGLSVSWQCESQELSKPVLASR